MCLLCRYIICKCRGELAALPTHSFFYLEGLIETSLTALGCHMQKSLTFFNFYKMLRYYEPLSYGFTHYTGRSPINSANMTYPITILFVLALVFIINAFLRKTSRFVSVFRFMSIPGEVYSLITESLDKRIQRSNSRLREGMPRL